MFSDEGRSQSVLVHYLVHGRDEKCGLRQKVKCGNIAQLLEMRATDTWQTNIVTHIIRIVTLKVLVPDAPFLHPKSRRMFEKLTGNTKCLSSNINEVILQLTSIGHSLLISPHGGTLNGCGALTFPQ